MKLFNIFKRNPCKECDYYIKESNICQLKSSAMDSPWPSLADRLFCESCKYENKKNNDKN